MFDALSDRLERIGGRLRGRGRISAQDLAEALGEIRTALLEADVELSVARAFCDNVAARCSIEELSKSLTPGQQVVKAVHEELISVLGGETLKITYASRPPTVILLAGLQGAGKTTTAGKLATWFKSQGRNPMVVAADLQRPAAVEQLRILAEQAGVGFHSSGASPVDVVKNGVDEAVRIGRDVVILDTAGRLSIDEALMAEVKAISAATSPHYTFLVIDAMTGQDAVHTAKAFDETLALDGVVLTKLDGDARGGAALSVKYVLGKPIAFASTGERLGDLELFHPDRMADRILGMGDVLSLIEQAERTMDTTKLGESAGRMLAGQFTFDDFLEQMNQIKKMGSFGSIARLIPGMGKQLKEAAAQFDDREIARIEGMVHSMTAQERQNPDLIDRSRQARIARGSGRSVADVAALLKQFKQMAKMMKSLGGGGAVPQIPGMGNPLAMRKQLQAMSQASPEQLSGLLGGAPTGAMSPPPWAAQKPAGGGKKGKKKGGRVTPPKGR